MCQLLGVSSDSPAQWSGVMEAFGQQGGATADNPDGWGVAWRETAEWHLHKAPEAASTSLRFDRLTQELRTQLLIAHVRKANPVTAHVPRNTHPFLRTCRGRQWVFAHNGKLPEILHPEGCCHPRLSRSLGETDSEHAFCFLLDEIASVFADDAICSQSFWLQTVVQLSDSIARQGQFNFLMSDGTYLLAYGHDRLYRSRSYRDDHSILLIASAPLTQDAAWESFRPGELLVARNGEVVTVLQRRRAGREVARQALSQWRCSGCR